MAERIRTEVAIIGAGPAGIAAACAAAECGASVLVLDEGWSPGGQIWRPGIKKAPRAALRWLERFERSGAELVDKASVVDANSDLELLVDHNGERLEVSAEKLILATGARELFLPFPGWTLPGVIGIGAAQALLKTGLSIRNVPTIVAGTGPLVLPVASALSAAGACLDIVADQVPRRTIAGFALSLWRYPQKVVEAARFRLRFLGCSYLSGLWVVAAYGDDRLREVELTDGNRTWRQGCELLCCSYGLVPNLELPIRIGCQIDQDVVVVDMYQQTTVDRIYCAGEPTGIGGVDLAIVEGQIAGSMAAGATSIPNGWEAKRDRLKSFSVRLSEAFEPRSELKDRLAPATTVCRCEDVAWGQIEPSWGFRQAKLYTRLGMGPCQARVCGPALSFLCGWRQGSIQPPVKACDVRILAP